MAFTSGRWEMTKILRVILGFLLLIFLTISLAVKIYSLLAPPAPKRGSDPGMELNWSGAGEPRVTSVNPRGPAAGVLQIGDEVIAVDGIKIRDDPRILFIDVPSGTRQTLTIRREGELRNVVIQTVPHQLISPDDRQRFDPHQIAGIFLLLAGWLIFLLRWDDKQAWLLSLMLVTLTGLIWGDARNLPKWLSFIADFGGVLASLFLPIFVHFFLIFPEKSPVLKRLPRLVTWLYLPFVLVVLPVTAAQQVLVYFPHLFLRFAWMRELYGNVLRITLVLAIIYLAAGLLSLVINYRAASLINRRRLRVLTAGSAAGFFNLFLIIAGETIGLHNRFPELFSWLNRLQVITFPLIPLSFIYAILRHKVIPISLIIRRGVRYLLVSRGSILLLVFVVSVVMYFGMEALFNYFNPQSGRTLGVISAIIAILVWQMARALHQHIIAPKVDRLFFRQSYDAQQIMSELADSLRTTTTRPQLVEMIATKIQSALHSANVSFLLRDDASGDYLCAYSCVYSFHHRSAVRRPFDCRLPGNSKVITQMVEVRQTIDLNGGNLPNNGSLGELLGEEMNALSKMESALLLPIASKDELLGVVSLGPHLGDLPFSNEDKRLLLSVSGHVSFALENTRLVEQLVEDARRRQELEAENELRAKELEEARKLQLSMVPKNIPQLPDLEIAAYMSTATEVGGDYYDFYLAPDGMLTVAVGDATGHGLKAGTLVTAMKSLFKTYAGEDNLPRVFQQFSHVLKEMNLRSLYMALTMVKIGDHRLDIASAGMPPILIYRSQTGTIEEVLMKSVPLGMLSDYSYRQTGLDLEQGDIVVLMSDGFPERFNQNREMFDYERVKKSLVESARRSPDEIIEHFVAAAEIWADGRPLDDDMTFVVLKVR
jgi:serine phosphatase RsbU (regulator of sigma subunit)